MVEKVVEFRLFKLNASFSDKQKEELKKQIKLYHNWRNIKGLKQIMIMDIFDHTFSVRVTEDDQSWHRKFSIKLCHLCHLQEHYAEGLYGQRRLLIVVNEMII